MKRFARIATDKILYVMAEGSIDRAYCKVRGIRRLTVPEQQLADRYARCNEDTYYGL